LVCSLLETCGAVFNKGSTAKKLDAFLVFLQVYVKTKIEAPLEVIFLLQDLFENLRPSAKRFESLEEALEALKEMNKASEIADKPSGPGDEDEEEDEEDEMDLDDLDARKEKGLPSKDGSLAGDTDDSESDGSDESLSSDDEGAQSSDEEEEEAVVVHDQFAKGPTQEEDDEFEKEFNKIMQDSVESRRSEKRVMTLFDVAIPVRSRQSKQEAAAGHQSEASEEEEEPEGSVTFAVLTKKGNKQQVRLCRDSYERFVLIVLPLLRRVPFCCLQTRHWPSIR